MNPIAPLVKIILITSAFYWGTSSVMITDHYILREMNFYPTEHQRTVKNSYQIYDLGSNLIHEIDGAMKFRVTTPLDTFQKNQFPIKVTPASNEHLLSSSAEKERFEGYKCRVEKKEKEGKKFFESIGPINIQYTEVSYFANIPWLDDILDSKAKREFAGFDQEADSPYHYLIYEYVEYAGSAPDNQVLRSIERGEGDTTLIGELLSLPLKQD